MSEHLTPEDLRRLEALMRDPLEAARIGAHTRACDACAAAVESHLAPRIDAVLDAAARPARPSPRWMWGGAGLAAAAAVGTIVALSLLREAPQPTPTPPPAPGPRIAAPSPSGNPQWDALVRQALDGTLPKPAVLDRLQQASGGLRSAAGDGERVKVLAPVNVVVLELRPQFGWTTAPGTTYIVELYTPQLDRVAQSPPLTGASWTPPNALARGRDYIWQLQVRRGDRVTVVPDPPDPPARFHVLDSEAAREVAAAAVTGRRFVLAVVEARHGLLAEAERDLDLAKGEVPETDRERLRKLMGNWRAP